MKTPKPVADFDLKCRGTRRKIRVRVYRNRGNMWDGATKAGFPVHSGRAIVVDSGPKVADMFFSRGCLKSGVVAHESTHAASWLLRNAPCVRHFKQEEENLAFWVGEITRALISAFYERGFYE